MALWRFNVQFCQSNASFSIYLSVTLESVERNGVQRRLGKPQKGENWCFLWVCEDSTSNFSDGSRNNLSTDTCSHYILLQEITWKSRFWVNHKSRKVFVFQKMMNSLLNRNFESSNLAFRELHREECVKQLIYYSSRDGRRRLRPLPTCVSYIMDSGQNSQYTTSLTFFH